MLQADPLLLAPATFASTACDSAQAAVSVAPVLNQREKPDLLLWVCGSGKSIPIPIRTISGGNKKYGCQFFSCDRNNFIYGGDKDVHFSSVQTNSGFRLASFKQALRQASFIFSDIRSSFLPFFE